MEPIPVQGLKDARVVSTEGRFGELGIQERLIFAGGPSWTLRWTKKVSRLINEVCGIGNVFFF